MVRHRNKAMCKSPEFVEGTVAASNNHLYMTEIHTRKIIASQIIGDSRFMVVMQGIRLQIGLLLFMLISPLLIAQSVLDSSLGRLRGLPADSVYASVATEVALDLAAQQKYNEAIVYLEKAQRIKSSSKNIYYELQSTKCRVYYRQRDYAKSFSLTYSMLKDSMKMEPKTLSVFYNLAAQNKFRQQNYTEALKYYQKAYYIINKYDFTESKDDALSNLSTMYWKLGKLTD